MSRPRMIEGDAGSSATVSATGTARAAVTVGVRPLPSSVSIPARSHTRSMDNASRGWCAQARG